MRQEDQNQLTETPKHEIPAPIVKTKPDLPSWDKMMAEAEALGGGAASRKRFVGVRQRPSGRWVAEIKDTIQKIRVWLGTYDTAEEAARAYDEAACLLRGATTRTNFWAGSDPGRSRPVLPPKITKLLLQRIRARSMDLETTSHLVDGGSQHCKRNDDVLAEKSTVAKRIKKNGENNVDCREGSSRNDTVVAESLTTKAVTINGSISDEGKNANDNSAIEFGMFDNPNYSASGDLSTKRMPAYYSAFDIAHEMMNPFMKQSEEEGGDCSFHSLGEDQLSIEGLSEISKRLNFERKFSASLYTYNGVTECLNRTMFVDGNSSDGTNSDGCDISDNQCQISSSCSSSLFNGEEDGELSLWSSLDLPSLCFFN